MYLGGSGGSTLDAVSCDAAGHGIGEREYTCTDPLSLPSSSSLYAPTAIVSPSIATLWPK